MVAEFVTFAMKSSTGNPTGVRNTVTSAHGLISESAGHATRDNESLVTTGQLWVEERIPDLQAVRDPKGAVGQGRHGSVGACP